MAKHLPPAREQLDRIEAGLERLLQFTSGDISPSVLNSTLNQMERLEHQCQNEEWATTVLLPPKPDSTTAPSYMLAEHALALQALREIGRDLGAKKIYASWKRW